MRRELGDLTLTAIAWQAGKSRGRKSVVLPITDAAREVLDSLIAALARQFWRRPMENRGRLRAADWTAACSVPVTRLTQRPARPAAPKATAGLEGLRFHDLRGTAATSYILAGLPLDDVATILGWELSG